MAEKSVSVRLSARVDQYVAAMKAAQASTTGFSRSTQRNLKTVGTQMMGVGRSMTTFVTAPLALMGAGAVKAAVDWESAWAGVTKTVDGTTEQMADLEDGLRQMSKELPATHQEIAAVAEAAGALGVATPDIEGFTRVMLDLGETTNLTSEEAATSIAKLMNVMQTAPDDVDNLGSALVHLGNNGASTEAEILDMATRIAGAAAVVGMSEQDVLGLANGLASLGIEAELGGTAISRVMTEIDKSVALGGDRLELFAETAGMSAQDFAAAWQADPTTALIAFIDGLGRLDASGGSVDQRFKDLKLNGTRVGDVLKRLITSGDLLTGSLELSNQAWGANTALTDEAAKRYETAAARFEMVRNKIVDLFIDLGEMVLPAVEAIVDVIGNLAEGFQALPGPVQAAVGGFLGLLAAVGPLVFIGGALVKNFVALRTAMTVLSGPALAASGALLGIGAAITIGFLAFERFSRDQRETEAATSAATAALNSQFPALMTAAVAAARAGEEVDALALANEALSMALSESEGDVLKIMSEMNMGSEAMLDVITRYESGALGVIDVQRMMAESFGLTREQAGKVAQAMASMDLFEIEDNIEALAADAGITEEQFAFLAERFWALGPAMESVDVEGITKQFLDGRVAAFGYEDSLVKAAEALAGVTRDVDPVAVFEALNEVMLTTSDEGLTLAGITEDVQAEMAAMGLVVDDANASFGAMTGKLPGFVFLTKELNGSFVDLGDGISQTVGKLPGFVFGTKELNGSFVELGNGVDNLVGKLPGFAFLTKEMNGSFVEVGDGIDNVVGKLPGFVFLTKEMNGSFVEVADEAMTAADAMEMFADGFEAERRMLLAGSTLLNQGAGEMREWADIFGESMTTVINLATNWVDTEDDIHKANLGWSDAIENNGDSLDRLTEAGQANRDELKQGLAAVVAHAQAQLDSGTAVDLVTETFKHNRDSMIDAAVAAGFERGEVEALVDALGMADDDWTAVIKISGQELAKRKIEALLLDMETLDEGVIAEVNTILETQGAFAALEYLQGKINTTTGTVTAKVRIANPVIRVPSITTSPGSRGSTVVVTASPYAMGGLVNGAELSILGEAGPEVVLPLNNPSRMSALLGLPQVGPRVAAAMTSWLPMHGWSGGGGGGDTYTNVTVNMPPGSNGDDVVRALRKWERRRGPVPISVR